MVQMTKEQYLAYVEGKAKKSPIVKNVCLAFLVGGLICVLGQGLLNLYSFWGMENMAASTLVSVTLVFLSALFTGLDLYDKLAKHAGAGTLVPITGFANAIVSPALEFQSEGFIMGMSAKLFTIAGPVLVFGITASVIYGLILAIFGF
ncbi:MAG: stage V sporulation protein AC [Oscillospiraceae bacterium]|jgi:stage V sporulation protein AC